MYSSRALSSVTLLSAVILSACASPAATMRAYAALPIDELREACRGGDDYACAECGWDCREVDPGEGGAAQVRRPRRPPERRLRYETTILSAPVGVGVGVHLHPESGERGTGLLVDLGLRPLVGWRVRGGGSLDAFFFGPEAGYTFRREKLYDQDLRRSGHSFSVGLVTGVGFEFVALQVFSDFVAGSYAEELSVGLRSGLRLASDMFNIEVSHQWSRWGDGLDEHSLRFVFNADVGVLFYILAHPVWQ